MAARFSDFDDPEAFSRLLKQLWALRDAPTKRVAEGAYLCRLVESLLPVRCEEVVENRVDSTFVGVEPRAWNLLFQEFRRHG